MNKPDHSLTLSVNDAAALVGLKRTQFLWWRKVRGIATDGRRLRRAEIEAAANCDLEEWLQRNNRTSKPQGQQQVQPASLDELQRRASEAADYAARGVDWPPK